MTIRAPVNLEERSVLAPVEQLSLANWSERYRYVTQGPLVGQAGEPVRWSNATFPLQTGIMDAIDDPNWPLVIVVGPPQAGGKTDCAAINPICRSLLSDHKDALYVSANAQKAKDQWHKKFRPAMEEGPLSRLLTDDREEGGVQGRRDFTNGTSLYITGAESVGNLSGSTIPTIICDDVQGMPATIGAQGHPVDIAFKRGVALPEEQRTNVALGTAGETRDYLWRMLKSSTFYRPHLPCPSCAHYDLLTWDRFEFDSTDERSAHESVHLVCRRCKASIDFGDLPGMLRGVLWVARGQHVEKGRVVGELPRTRSAGFWWNAFYWPFVYWGEFAAVWVRSRGHHDLEKDFQQHVLCEAWAESEEDADALTIVMVSAHRKVDHCYGIVPDERDLFVVITADVHDRFLYYIVRAWSKTTGSSWLIDAGTEGVHGPKKSEELTDDEKRIRVGHAIRRALEQLWVMERDGWPTRTKGQVRARLCLIDGGYRPDAVNQFCLLRNGGLPRRTWEMIYGRSSRVSGHRRPIWPKRPIRRMGRVYREVNVDEAKLMLRDIMTTPSTEKGAWHTYSDRDLESYHKHMVSEHLVPKMRSGQEVLVWEKREDAGPNHWWDCEVYQVIAAVALGVNFGAREQTKAIVVTNYFQAQRKNNGRSGSRRRT